MQIGKILESNVADADNMISYTWRLQQNRFNAVGRLSCSGCGKDYYEGSTPFIAFFLSTTY